MTVISLKTLSFSLVITGAHSYEQYDSVIVLVKTRSAAADPCNTLYWLTGKEFADCMKNLLNIMGSTFNIIHFKRISR